jgi:hypothetical protein
MKNKFRITKKPFNIPAVTNNAIHYFPYADDVRRISDTQLSINVCYYNLNRKKWLSDSQFIDNNFADELYAFAIKKDLIDKQPISAGFASCDDGE